HARIAGPQDIEQLPLDDFFDVSPDDMVPYSTLASLLWARTTTSERAYAFLRALDPSARVAVYGHDVARAGFAIDREPLLCVSTSFGCFDGDKLYLEWDLAEPANSAAETAARGLRALYPHAPPMHRDV